MSSFAALQASHDSAAQSAARMGLSLGPTQDKHEHEAEHVAKHVASGGHLGSQHDEPDKPGWSLAAIDLAHQPNDPARRRADPQTTPSAPERHAQRKLDTAAPAPQVQQPAHLPRPGGGHALDPETRRDMEHHFELDFSRVRVHTGPAAEQSAKSMRAVAYTVGTDIFFAANRYSPHSLSGRELLAHELTHVVQQSPALVRRPANIHAAPASVQRSLASIIGEAIPHPIDKLEKKVRSLPGFRLISTILGHDPFNDTPVPQDPTHYIQGFLDFVPGGNEAFDRLRDSGALDAALAWLRAELGVLDLTAESIGKLFKDAYQVFKDNFPHVEAALEQIKGIFTPPLQRLITFAKHAFNKFFEIAVEFALKNLGGQEVVDVLKGAGETFLLIAKDPAAFLQHLLDGVYQGFTQFKDNIVKHLKEGAMKWIFGKVENLHLPAHFDRAGIVDVILQITGLTWPNFRKRLVKAFGSEEAVAFLEKTFDFVMQIVRAKNLAAAWKIILDKAEGLMDTIFEKVKQWMITNVVVEGVKFLISLFSPIGALVKAIQTIYKAVTWLIRAKDQIKDLIKSVTASLSAIAHGDTTQAANAVEGAMASGIAPALGFIASQLGLGDIGSAVSNIVNSIREKVGDAIDKVVQWVVDRAKGFYEKTKETAGKILDWFRMRKDFLIGEQEHAIYMQGTEDDAHLMIASDPIPWSEYLKEKRERGHPNPAMQKLLEDTEKLAIEVEKRLSPSSTPEAKAEVIKKKRELFDKIAANLVKLGFTREPTLPASKIDYSKELTEDGGAIVVTANPLSELHPEGSGPSDEAPIWANLGSDLVARKSYVQGHLLNDNLGGEGRRFNLTPINKKANSSHLHQVETHVKNKVKGHTVMFYQVRAVYGTHSSAVQRLTTLKDKRETDPAKETERQTRVKELRAETRLCTEFQFASHELEFKNQAWAKKDKTEKNGTVTHTLQL